MRVRIQWIWPAFWRALNQANPFALIQAVQVAPHQRPHSSRSGLRSPLRSALIQAVLAAQNRPSIISGSVLLLGPGLIQVQNWVRNEFGVLHGCCGFGRVVRVVLFLVWRRVGLFSAVLF
jgi:hypothetical protein